MKQRRKIGKLLGDAGSIGLIGSSKLGAKSSIVVGSGGLSAATGTAAAKIGGPGPTTRYMVKVRLDSKKVPAITQLREELDGVEVGSRVVVNGTGDEAKLQLE